MESDLVELLVIFSSMIVACVVLMVWGVICLMRFWKGEKRSGGSNFLQGIVFVVLGGSGLIWMMSYFGSA